MSEQDIHNNINGAADYYPGPAPESPRWPELDPSALRGLAGDFVRLIEPATEADPAALLIQFLAAFGNAAGKAICRIPSGTEHSLNLFIVLCGASSKARKGTSWQLVKQLFQLSDPEWARECIRSGLSSGEGMIWAVRDAVQRQNVEIDPGVPDKRLLVHEAEYASLLKVLGREGNTLSAIIRDAWDAGDLCSMTKNSPARATGAHISIVAHITIEELLRYFNSTEAANGFGNRFLFLCVKRSKCLPRGGRIDQASLRALAERVRSALAFAHEITELRFGDSAFDLWDRLYPELSSERPGLLGSMLARAEAQVSRLACLYAAMDCDEQVEPAHLEAATAVWEYCETSIERIFGKKLGNPVADAILAALRGHPDGMTRTEISNLFARNLRAGQIEQALEELLRADLVEREPKSSHTPERWQTKTTKSTKRN